MRFAVLAAADSWYARDLARAAAGDFEITTLPFSEISAEIPTPLSPGGRGAGGEGAIGERGLRVISAGRDLADFDAVVVRTMPPGSLEQVVFRMDCLARYEAAGGVVINPARAIEAAVDKFLTSAKLQAAGLLTPRTIVCQTADDAMAAFGALGGDVVLKPIFGSEGRGITRLNDEALALRAFKMLAQLGAVLYIQEFIEHEGCDLRLLLIGERVLAMRRKNLLDWRTNISRGAKAEAFIPDDSLIEMAHRAAAAVGAPFAGVDLLPGRDGKLYAIEVNAVPGWKGLAKALGVDVARLVLEFVAGEVAVILGKMTVMETTSASPIVNVGLRLSQTAVGNPSGIAVVMPRGRDAAGKRIYQTLTFRELDDDSNLLADGLAWMGVRPGMRLALLVPPSIDFISLVFAMFKAGVVSVLIDPGMGRRNMIGCLADSQPEGFVGISLAQAVRSLLRSRFPLAKYNVTVGRRWFWGGKTLRQLRSRELSEDYRPAETKSDDPAAIIFTTGSTGPPKGVLYRHGNFDRQADEIRDFYGIQPGEIDLPGFPLFALFNCAMGVTTVIPDMDPTRPAKVDPRNIIEAINDWRVTQAFGSPAIWNVVGRYCEEHKIVLPTLKRVLSAGAPVPPHVLRRMRAAISASGHSSTTTWLAPHELKRMKAAIPEGADVHTPYGATEALPVASISASEVLGETAAKSAIGAGTCVGRHFPGIQWKVIRITDEPIATLDQAEELPAGEIGELIVRGPVVTTEYVTRTESNALHKIKDGEGIWHRMGDVGWLEVVGQASRQPEDDSLTGRRDARPTRFWFCGRKSHRVITAAGTLYTIPCEAIFNQHPRVYRSALVGAGERGQQRPVIFVEPWPEQRVTSKSDTTQFLDELRALAKQHKHTAGIVHFFFMNALPVDIRHNAKIFREKLKTKADWYFASVRTQS